MIKKYNYTEEDLIKLVPISETYSDVCRKLGLKNTSGNSYERVRNKINSLGLDTKHFTGKKHFCGKLSPHCFKRKAADEILVENSPNRVSHAMLKRFLLEYGIKYECSICELSQWMGKPITLDIDHVDGIWSNNKLENLRFLCPNCHRQTKTFGNTKRIKMED